MNESEVPDTRQMPGSMWVQARSPGIRVRILATRHKSWVVTAQVNQRRIGDDYVLTASRPCREGGQGSPRVAVGRCRHPFTPGTSDQGPRWRSAG